MDPGKSRMNFGFASLRDRSTDQAGATPKSPPPYHAQTLPLEEAFQYRPDPHKINLLPEGIAECAPWDRRPRLAGGRYACA